MCYRIIANYGQMDGIKTKSTGFPAFFSFLGHTFSPHFACRYSFLPGSIWEPVRRLCGNLKVGEVSCVKSVDCIFVVDILLITVTIYFNFLQAK